MLMNYLILIFAIVAVAIIALLLLRLRLRCRIGEDQRSLFAGLGRTGVELDWVTKNGYVKLFGYSLKQFPLEKSQPDKKEVVSETAEPAKDKKVRSVNDYISVLKSSFGPIWHWLVSLLRATKFEELQGDIKAGFDSPDLTGQTYGYYHALVGAVPVLSGRINYYPDWDGASFKADFNASLAMPLYSLVGRTIQLVFRLPLRKIINLAIGKKKKEKVGYPNVQ